MSISRLLSLKKKTNETVTHKIAVIFLVINLGACVYNNNESDNITKLHESGDPCGNIIEFGVVEGDPRPPQTK